MFYKKKKEGENEKVNDIIIIMYTAVLAIEGAMAQSGKVLA